MPLAEKAAILCMTAIAFVQLNVRNKILPSVIINLKSNNVCILKIKFEILCILELKFQNYRY